MKRISKLTAWLLYLISVFSLLIFFFSNRYYDDILMFPITLVVASVLSLYFWKTETDWFTVMKDSLHNGLEAHFPVHRIPRWMIVMFPLAIFLLEAVLAVLFQAETPHIYRMYSEQDTLVVICATALMMQTKREYNDTVGDLVITTMGMTLILIFSNKRESMYAGVVILLLIALSDMVFREERTARTVISDLLPPVLSVVIYETMNGWYEFSLLSSLGWEMRGLHYLYSCVHYQGPVILCLAVLFFIISVGVVFLLRWMAQFPVDGAKTFSFFALTYGVVILLNIVFCIAGDRLPFQIPTGFICFFFSFVPPVLISGVRHASILSFDEDLCYEDSERNYTTGTIVRDRVDEPVWFGGYVSYEEEQYAVLFWPESSLWEPVIILLEGAAEDTDWADMDLVDDPAVREAVYNRFVRMKIRIPWQIERNI